MSIASEQPTTHAVNLRPAQPADAALLARWRDEPSVRRFQPLGAASLAQLRAELTRQAMGDLFRGQGEKYQWIIRSDEQPVGWITLVITNWDHGLGEIGYALTTSHQKKGLMPQALSQLLAEVFLRSKLERIEARCAVDNTASQKVLEKLGFKREGLLRGYFVLRGQRIDNYLFAILRDDYMSQLRDD